MFSVGIEELLIRVITWDGRALPRPLVVSPLIPGPTKFIALNVLDSQATSLCWRTDPFLVNKAFSSASLLIPTP